MNEKKFSSLLQEAAANVQLSREAKNRIRGHLVALVKREVHPTHVPFPKTPHALVPVRSPIPFSFSLAVFHRHVVAPLLIALLVLSGTGFTAYAAEDALPGEALYSMKINVNEEVYRIFLLSDSSRLAWLTKRAERRLKEAGELAAAGTLDTEKAAVVLDTLAKHIKEAALLTESVVKEDPAVALEASSELEATLESEGSVLARLAVEEDASLIVREVVEAAAEQAQGVSEVRAAAENIVLSTTTPEAGSENIATPTSETPAISKKELPAPLLSEEIPEQDPREQAFQKMDTKAKEAIAGMEQKVNAYPEEKSFMKEKGTIFIDEAQRLQELGAEKRDMGNYRGALEAVRKAYALTLQADAMLEAETLFSLSILPEEVTETETGRVTPEDVSQTELETERTTAERVLGEVRELFGKNGFPIGVSERVADNIKEARSYVLRAEIQIALEENAKAARLYREAHASALRAKEIIAAAQAEGHAAPLGAPSGAAPTPVAPLTPVTPVTPAPLPNTPSLPALDTVRVYHSFDTARGVHTYRGTFVTPTPCFSLGADALVAESFPEQITLALTTKDSSEICAQVLDEKPFSVEVKASAGAILRGVSLNSAESKFELVEEKGIDAQMPVPTLLP